MNIQLDLEIYKRLTLLLAQGEDYNALIGRLLDEREVREGPGDHSQEVSVWARHAMTFPVGTKLYASSKGKTYTATVQVDGLVIPEFPDEVFRSLSAAAIKVAGGNRNGRTFWKYRDAQGRLGSIERFSDYVSNGQKG